MKKETLESEDRVKGAVGCCSVSLVNCSSTEEKTTTALSPLSSSVHLSVKVYGI